MKNLFKNGIFILLAFLVFSSFQVVAQHNALKKGAKNFINKTNPVLRDARKMVLDNKADKKDLLKALWHQKKARQLFENQRYRLAIQHSARARQLAITVIKSNKGAISTDWNFSVEDEKLIGNSKIEELDGAIKPAEINEQLINEELAEVKEK